MLSHFSHVQLFAAPMDCILPGSSIHGILQARILESVAMPSSRGLCDPGMEPACLLHWQVGSLPLGPPGKPSFPLGLLKLYKALLKKYKYILLFLSMLVFLAALKLSSSCGKQGLLSSCGAWASHCSGFSCAFAVAKHRL